MKFKEILKRKNENLSIEKVPCIAFLGDSVTQGCFEVYVDTDGGIGTVHDSKYVYHSKLRDMLGEVFPKVPINIINAGISGNSSGEGLERIERDVLSYNPDLVVVCFGLNDCANGIDGICEYVKNLEMIFEKVQSIGADVIFMTPNMMNTKLSHSLKDELLIKLAKNFAKIQCEGVLDAYVDAAIELCNKKSIPVCNCYKKWKLLYENGADTTGLLSNHLNHPTRNMHSLFATSLFDMIMFEL